MLIKLEKPFQFIEEAVSEVPVISDRLEPNKKFKHTAQLEDYYSQNLTLLPR